MDDVSCAWRTNWTPASPLLQNIHRRYTHMRFASEDGVEKDVMLSMIGSYPDRDAMIWKWPVPSRNNFNNNNNNDKNKSNNYIDVQFPYI